MRKYLSDVTDKHIGKSGIVLGLGPSLNADMTLIEKASEDSDQVIISCNLWDSIIPNIKVDYWVLANTQDRMRVCKNLNRYNKKTETTLVWAQSADRSNVQSVDEKLVIDHIPFNHNVRNISAYRFCKEEILQERFKEYCDIEETYSNGHTVAVHMTTLGIMLGLKEIKFSGVDLDYRQGYANKKARPMENAQSEINKHKHLINADFKLILEAGEKVGVSFSALSSCKYIKEITR
jgi:hypothetical protein